MNVFMIGMDHAIARLDTGEAGDSRVRHLKYARALRRRDPTSQLVVLTRAPHGVRPEAVEEGGLYVQTIPCHRAFFLPKVLHLGAQLLSKGGYDLITTQTPFDDGLAGLLLARRYRIPLHVQMRSSFLDDRYWISERPLLYRGFNWIGKLVARRAEFVRVISQGEKERLESLFSWIRGKVFRLPPLVNLDTFTSPPTEQEIDHVREQLRRRRVSET